MKLAVYRSKVRVHRVKDCRGERYRRPFWRSVEGVLWFEHVLQGFMYWKSKPQMYRQWYLEVRSLGINDN